MLCAGVFRNQVDKMQPDFRKRNEGLLKNRAGLEV